MSDDEALTKRAIEEILREANESRTQGNARLMENKINPLVKTNKNFLGRTVKSVMAHNQRHSERIMRNCSIKLKEMDMAKEKAKYHEKKRQHMSKQEEERRERRHKYKKKSKKRYTVKRERAYEEREQDNENYQYECDYNAENTNYADVYYDYAQAALASHAYHQVGKWLCYQTLLSDTYNKPQLKQRKVESPSIMLSSDSDDDDDSVARTENIVDLTCEEENIVSFNNILPTETKCVDYIDLSSDSESDSDLNVSSALECQLLEIPTSNIINVEISSDDDD